MKAVTVLAILSMGFSLVPAGSLAHSTGTASPDQIAGLQVARVSEHTALPNSLAGHGSELAFASPGPQNGSIEFWIVNTSSGAEERVTRIQRPPDAVHFDSAAYDGRYVAWSDDRTGKLQVYVADTQTGSFRALTHSQSDERQVRLSNGTVVWSTWGNFTISAVDLATGNRLHVGTGGGVGPTAAPDVFGNRVVWARSHGGANFDVFLRDLSTGETYQLSADELVQATPRIWRDRVVWAEADLPGTEGAGNGSRIVLADLSENRTMYLTPNQGKFKHPIVWGDWAAWEINPDGLAIHHLPNAQTVVLPSTGGGAADVVLTSDLFGFTLRGPDGNHVYAGETATLFKIHSHGDAPAAQGWSWALAGIGAVLILASVAWYRMGSRKTEDEQPTHGR